MELKINGVIVKEFLKKHPNESMSEATRYYSFSEDRLTDYDIDVFKPEELDTLQALANGPHAATNGAKGLAKKIQTFKNIRENPGGSVVKRLETLEQALKLYLQDVTNHWLFTEEKGYLLPYYIDDIEYTPYDARSENPAHCTMTLKALQRGKIDTSTHTWRSDDLAEGIPVSDLLTQEKLFLPNKELLEGYHTSMEKFKKFQPQTGEQFVAEGEADEFDSNDDDGWRRWSNGRISMVRDGLSAKLVMDDESDEGAKKGDDDGLESNSYWEREKEEAKQIALPVHPFVKLFDLDRHTFVVLSTDQLTEYTWNPALGDKLILPPAHKEVVTILMDTASEEIDDIIKGKSGGTIVICTGEPGTGKTLTAEVTSEVIKRPLYKVHCSQLGTDEEAIEKELTKVLHRATRWKALLLIDEADVYVRERSTDIQQNAIVGVFLRVLEYYRGVLFMTSNRATIIDDAIMSRATVHLKYEKPNAADLKTIWTVLATQFKIKMPDTFIDQLVATFPSVSGRDVKALLKLVIRYSRKKGGKITLDLFKLLAVHKDIKPAS